MFDYKFKVPEQKRIRMIVHTDCKKGETAKASYDEVKKVLELMHLENEYEVYMGAGGGLPDEKTPLDSPGARFIIQEAMREDARPLFIGLQGAVTDLASAILMKPEICQRMTAIWIGGGQYPEGGFEFNLMAAGDAHWPHGEIWGLGDQGVISVLMEEQEKTDSYEWIPAPSVDTKTMKYIHNSKNRKIRVYHHVNDRLTLEDFFCKLQLNFPEADS